MIVSNRIAEWFRIWVLSVTFYFGNYGSYLIRGTGNAWAWHRRAKLFNIFCSNVELFNADENVGALKPTGSKIN